jgi:hypothetical protein
MNITTTTVFLNPFGDTVTCWNAPDFTELQVLNLYQSVCKYFKRRGFKVGKDEEMFKNYKIIAKNHKYGIKNGLEFNSEFYPRGFKFEFYQNEIFKNTSGGKYDFDKYEMMPYRLKLTYRNEVLKLASFLQKKGINVVIKRRLTDIEKILEDEQSNTHIHGGNINSLDDIGKYMESDYGRYDRTQNSTDRNKKQIVCGETKYFYDYNNILSRGVVYHHINNMWWVIVNGKRYNISSFSLFDYSPELTRRKKLSKEQQINRMEEALRYWESKKQYQKCIRLNNSIEKLKSGEKTYRVWSIKHNSWWGPNNNHYTSNISQAGVYLEQNILNNQSYYNNGVSTKAILIE